jgi:hypothetical protein
MKCKNNHESTATDFCSVCGIEMAGEAAPDGNAAPGAQDHEICPVCGSVKSDNFCGDCGYNFVTKTGGIAAPPPIQPTVVTSPTEVIPTSSEATAEAPAPDTDAGGHRSVDASGAEAPEKIAAAKMLEVYLTIDTAIEGAPQTLPRIFPLESGDYSIGRASLTRKIKPSISADGDDGVSHKHALIRQHGDSFAIMDLGSSNGTKLNGVEIIPNTVHTLKKDDVIAMGRWTLLTIHSRIV